MSLRAPLLPPARHVRWEVREVVRKRLFQIRTIHDVLEVIEGLGRERAAGCLKLNLGPGGVPQSMEFEERSKLSA